MLIHMEDDNNLLKLEHNFIGMKNVLLSAVFVGFSAVAAFAASHAGEMDFAVVDADANGMVSMEEATAAGWKWSEEDFKAADSDADGSLNAEEFAAASAN